LIAQRGLKAYPDLMETVWQKNASAPPNGPFDIIGLHRVVKTGIPVGVLFICPGTWGSGEQLISNPPTCPLFPAHCPFPWSKLSPHVYNHKAKSSQLKKNPKNARK
jgi:hypothetical protein